MQKGFHALATGAGMHYSHFWSASVRSSCTELASYKCSQTLGFLTVTHPQERLECLIHLFVQSCRKMLHREFFFVELAIILVTVFPLQES